MSITVRIPTPLQKLTKNQAEINASGSNVKELIEDMDKNFPGIKERICEETGKVRRFINIYVNDEDIRFLQREETSLKDGDKVSIIPAIAGGGGTSHFRMGNVRYYRRPSTSLRIPRRIPSVTREKPVEKRGI